MTTVWLILQSSLAFGWLYSSSPSSIPPKIIIFGIAPMIVAIITLFIRSKGKAMIDSLPLKQLTLLHLIRFPIKLILYGLYLSKSVPLIMTYEGGNFDILSGVTAPLIYYFCFIKNEQKLSQLLIWNFLCLGLLFNIIVRALLSAPSPLQRFAFDQPNIAILYFPFALLPVFLVPVVLFAHFSSIHIIINTLRSNKAVMDV